MSNFRRLIRGLRKYGLFLLRHSWLFARMIAWVFRIRIMRPRVPFQQLVKIATHSPPTIQLSFEDLEQCFLLLDAMKLYGTSNPCVPRALVRFRYLWAIGVEAHLYNGVALDKQDGHAWIVIDGEAYMENAENLKRYQPMLYLPHPKATLQPYR